MVYSLIEPQPFLCTPAYVYQFYVLAVHPPPQINSTSSGIQIWNLVGGLRWSFSAAPYLREQSTCSVDCFHRGASLLIFDGILNVILLEELFILGVTQGNLELHLSPNSLDSHKNTKTIR